MVRLLTAWLLFLGGAASMAVAQPSTAPDEETICLAFATHWVPQNHEIREIVSEPIAPSFRRIMDAGSCARFSLVKEDLISWHLKFGNEQSTTAALAYLEEELTRDAAPPASYKAALQRAWRSALPDLVRAAATPQPADVNYSARYRAMEASAAIATFQRLANDRHIYINVARAYLRAGEEFGSQLLLARADTLLAAAEAGATFLQPLQDQEPARGLFHFNIDGVPEGDFRLRIAVARAAATGLASDVERAQMLVAAAERPFFRQLAERTYTGEDDLCDFGGDASDLQELETTCRNVEEVQEQLTSYWMNRAMLDLLGGNIAADSVSLTLRLLEEEEKSDSPRCCWYSAREDLFRLRVARAQAAARAAAAAAAAAWAGEVREDARSDAFEEALREYSHAVNLASPDEAPRRFRQVAESWLGLWSTANASLSRDRDADVVWPQRARYATYLRAVLKDLDAIAIGDAESQ